MEVAKPEARVGSKAAVDCECGVGGGAVALALAVALAVEVVVELAGVAPFSEREAPEATVAAGPSCGA